MKPLFHSFFGLVFLLATFSIFSAVSAEANHICSKRSVLLKQLATEYQEEPVAIGMATDGSIVELLTSKSGSWTIISTTGSVSCLVLAGEEWITKPVSNKKEKSL